jgi:hypothetical protein
MRSVIQFCLTGPTTRWSTTRKSEMARIWVDWEFDGSGFCGIGEENNDENSDDQWGFGLDCAF